MNKAGRRASLKMRQRTGEAEMVTLVERARAGEKQAFSELVNAFADRIHAYLYNMVGDRELAEDLTQETFVRAWQALSSFRGGAAFGTWLYRIATNLAIDAMRRRKREGPQQSLDEPVEGEDSEMERQLADPARGPDEVVEARELQAAVREAIGELSPKLRAVLLMYDFEGMSYEEIAQALGVPMGTVKSRLFNARQQLRKLVAQKVPIEEYLGAIEQELMEQ